MATNINGLAPIDATRVGKTATRLSWGSVFAGVVIAVAVQLVLGSSQNVFTGVR